MSKEIEDIWNAIDGIRTAQSNINTTVSAGQATMDANFKHISLTLSELKAMRAAEIEQDRQRDLKDGEQDAKITAAQGDITAIGGKLRDHVDSHWKWLALAASIIIGLPAAAFAVYGLAKAVLH
jgi:hypothetical protein